MARCKCSARMAGECTCGAWQDDRPDSDEIAKLQAENAALRERLADRERFCVEAGNQLERAELERDEARAWRQCADHLADEVNVLVRRRVVDMRSPVADALLDYRYPPASPRGDRLAELERERDAAIARAEAAVLDSVDLYASVQHETAEAIAAFAEDYDNDQLAFASDIRAGAWKEPK